VIVVDAAAVVDALTLVEGSQDLRALLAHEDLHAPSLLDFEVVAAVRGLVLGGKLSAARGHDVLGDFEALPVHRWESAAPLRERVFNLSAYDAAYVALAEALGCPLLTRDARVARVARSTGHEVEVLVR
jgi:predicted nucleic acid-binding protein